MVEPGTDSETGPDVTVILLVENRIEVFVDLRPGGLPSLKLSLHLCSLPGSTNAIWELKLPLHSCSLPGSMNAMEVSIWGGRLHFRKVG
ncbi:hypothetical protein Tco_0229558, partial [Tanacetum coccineum]